MKKQREYTGNDKKQKGYEKQEHTKNIKKAVVDHRMNTPKSVKNNNKKKQKT